MNANIAGIYGAQIFRQDDRPLYRRGFSVAIAVLAVGFSLAIARWIDDFRRRRKIGTAAKISTNGQDFVGEKDASSAEAGDSESHAPKIVS